MPLSSSIMHPTGRCQAVARAKSVAIIGAGAAGLAAANTLRKSCQIAVFERNSDFVGGVWKFNTEPGKGPMYCRLRTNLPKEIMAFPDWEWIEPKDTSFVTHEHVLEYLKSYCYDQGLDKYIRFGHEVVSVRRSTPAESSLPTEESSEMSEQWIVETKQSRPEAFDAVVLANGHYAKPMVPRLPGIENVPGKLFTHSSTYRRAEDFKDKVVALLGAASSGQDIALELSSAAKHVHLCHRGPMLPSELPKNLTQQLGSIESLDYDTKSSTFSIAVQFNNSTTKVPVDHLMFCTGYDYHFPFLSDELKDLTRPSHVPRLWNHVTHCALPGLYFIGLCTHIVPFPQFYLQAKFVEAMVLGRLQLPTDAEAASLNDEAERLASGVSARHLHTLGDQQWDYNDRLADLAGCERLPAVMRLIYDDVKLERKFRLANYKRWAYRITGLDTFEKQIVG